jgi:hypothetical protein
MLTYFNISILIVLALYFVLTRNGNESNSAIGFTVAKPCVCFYHTWLAVTAIEAQCLNPANPQGL